LTIAATQGTYPNAPTHRAYQIAWSNVPAPAGLTINSAPLTQGDGGPDSWSYDVGSQTLSLNLASRSVSSPIVVGLQ
jgi:hypothetical protein